MKERQKSYGERYVYVQCKTKIKKGKIFFIIISVAVISFGVLWLSGI